MILGDGVVDAECLCGCGCGGTVLKSKVERKLVSTALVLYCTVAVQAHGLKTQMGSG
jgi:hypothetical protein